MAAYHRMPLGYGPFPGPRQTTTGLPHHNWATVRSTTHTVVFKAEKQHLASFLPSDRFWIEGSNELAYASFAFVQLVNLPWLAGRGYSHFGFYIHDVACRDGPEIVLGKYLSVLFEDSADPITSGREEKVWAEFDFDSKPESLRLSVRWDQCTFGEFNLENLQSYPDQSSDTRTAPGETQRGVLHYKYIPKTGCPGQSDVEYPTFTPPVSEESRRILRTAASQTGAFRFHAHSFDELPTLHHVAARLSQIRAREIVQCSVVEEEGSSDIRTQRKLEP